MKKLSARVLWIAVMLLGISMSLPAPLELVYLDRVGVLEAILYFFGNVMFLTGIVKTLVPGRAGCVDRTQAELIRIRTATEDIALRDSQRRSP